MRGVEVLNTIPILDVQPIPIIGCLAIVLILLGVALFIIGCCTMEETIGEVGVALVMIGICFMFLFFIAKVGVETGEYKYQVTISDEVSMSKFLEKYEIESVDGKIYTVTEINE